MVIEVQLKFKDELTEGEGNPIEFSYTVTAPDDFEVTGGNVFVENPDTHVLDRFSFRIDRDESGRAVVTVLDPIGA